MRPYFDAIIRQLAYVIDSYRFESFMIYTAILANGFMMIVLNGQSLLRDSTAGSMQYTVPTYPINPATAVVAQTAGINTTTPTGTAWPMHGIVTTQFGQPHRPWQTTHTGIDISSAARSGVTPIKPFRAGTVIAVNRSGGFGNHVIVDHGGGLTSLYGHLHDIAVYIGQRVSPGDVLGHEGSTGNSTGTHLHFEVRQDGKPINPGSVVPGRP